MTTITVSDEWGNEIQRIDVEEVERCISTKQYTLDTE